MKLAVVAVWVDSSRRWAVIDCGLWLVMVVGMMLLLLYVNLRC